MAEASRSAKATAPMQNAVENAVMAQLISARYSADEAKRLLGFAKKQGSGSNITIAADSDLKLPFNQNIRKSDVIAVAKALADIHNNPKSQDMILTKLGVRGPQTSPEPVKAEVPGGAVQLYSVKIDGDRTYAISVRPGGDPKKIADVTMATVVDPVSGNKIDVTAAYLKAFDSADSEAIHIFKPIVPRKLQ